MTDPRIEASFAVCVANDGCDDLTVGVLYRVLPDEAGASENLLRVVDDSGEDYLYPSSRFVAVAAAEAESPGSWLRRRRTSPDLARQRTAHLHDDLCDDSRSLGR